MFNRANKKAILHGDNCPSAHGQYRVQLFSDKMFCFVSFKFLIFCGQCFMFNRATEKAIWHGDNFPWTTRSISCSVWFTAKAGWWKCQNGIYFKHKKSHIHVSKIMSETLIYKNHQIYFMKAIQKYGISWDFLKRV